MVRFAMLNTGRIAMVLVVYGMWGTMALIAKAVVQPVYLGGLVSLRTSERSKRRAKLSKVVATPWIYAMVFAMMFTTFTGMGILVKDTADYFGFQKHVLSWEYILHPKYVALLCASALAGSATAVATFRRNTSVAPASPEQFDRAWKNGLAAFMATGAIGFLFFLVREASQSAPDPPAAMPGGPAVAKAIAIVVATKSQLKLATGKERERVKEAVRAATRRLGIEDDVLDRLATFANTLPNRADASSKIIEQRMIAKGFDPDTARATRRQVGRVARV